MSENWQQSEICIVINDKSQHSTAKHLSYDGLLQYKFVNHCVGERIFKIREHLAKLQAKWKQFYQTALGICIGHVRHFVATCFSLFQQ